MRNGIHKIEKDISNPCSSRYKDQRNTCTRGNRSEIHDGRMLKKLIDHVLDSSSSESNMAKVKSVLADGAYDSNTNFQYLENKRIKPGIKARKSLLFPVKTTALGTNR